MNINEEPLNYEQKCLCVLVLDTSGSMRGEKIDKLNLGLKQFQKELLKDPVSRDRLEVSIVSFGKDINVIQEPMALTEFAMPELSCFGNTRIIPGIRKAVEIVAERKKYYKFHGLSYYRPWIVTMTDGRPNGGQPIDKMAQEIAQAHKEKAYTFMALGVGDDVDMEVLKRLSVPDFPPMHLEATKFIEFFLWLSSSISAVTKSFDGEFIMQDPSSWLTVMSR